MSGDAARLLIDAGNSRIKWSMIADNGAEFGRGAFEHDGAPDWAALPQPNGAWISNVAGESAAGRIDALIDSRWASLPRTIVRAQARQCGVTNCYEEPSSLGSDRWCGLIGARAAFPGENLLIATFGTATTLEALRGDGTSRYYVAENFSTVAHPQIIEALKQAAQELKARYHLGWIFTTDALFQETPELIHQLNQQNVSSIDLVTSTFLTISQVRGKKAGAVLAVSDECLHGKFGFRDAAFFEAEQKTIEVARQALRLL